MKVIAYETHCDPDSDIEGVPQYYRVILEDNSVVDYKGKLPIIGKPLSKSKKSDKNGNVNVND